MHFGYFYNSVNHIVAFFKDILIGAISCKIEEREGARVMYIMTIGVLVPYRKKGLGNYKG